jgi:hypothetical protein
LVTAGDPLDTIAINSKPKPPLNDLDFPSKSMKFVNTIGDVKLAGAARAPADEKSPRDASEAPPFEIKPRRDRSRLIRRVADASRG